MTNFIRALIYLSPFVMIILPSFNIEGIIFYYPFLVFLVTIVFLQSRGRLHFNINIYIEMIIIGTFLIYSFLSVLWSANPQFGFNHTVIPQSLGILVVFLINIVLKADGHINALIKSFSFIYILLLILGLMDIWLNVQIFASESGMKGMTNDLGNGYPLATFGNTNDFAQFIIFFYPITLVYLKNLKLNRFLKWPISIAVFISTFIVVLNTESRIAYITLPLILLCMAYFSFSNIVIKRTMLFILIVGMTSYLFTQFDFGEIYMDDSTDLRILIFNAGIEITKDNLLFGAGSGSTIYLLNDYISDYRYNIGLPMHNLIIKFFAEYGVIISLLFFFMITRVIYKLQKTIHSFNSSYFREIGIALLAILIFFPFSTSASSDASIQASTWLILGLSLLYIKLFLLNFKREILLV